jgi:opacity protein-like surface antigen
MENRMKIHGTNNSLRYSLPLAGLVLALSGSGHAGAMGPVVEAPGAIYFGVFGGGGSSTRTHINQYGTAFFVEDIGGPLAVDAFGRTNSRSVGLVGGQVGYQWGEHLANPFTPNWSLVPAFELEGYYLTKSDFVGHEINNDTIRLAEHDFLVKYPMDAGIFLANAVLGFNSANCGFQPYVGAGIGAALISITHAQAIQIAPPEIGVNHYNSNPNDTEATFAGQVKVGAGYSFTPHISIFAEYRWLYLGPSNYTFGSTVFPGHAATSSWRVELDAQNYNTGAAGIRYTV